jgi:hypothetical protein
MRQRTALGFGLFCVATFGGIATYTLTRSQPPAPSPRSDAVHPAVYAEAAPAKPVRHDLSQMLAQNRVLFLSARSGAEWLMRMDNSVNGRFLPGWLPAVNAPVEPENYLHQAGATYAMAKAARYFGDERYLMKARQAILSLLADTRADPSDPNCRYTSLPTIAVNRLASAGLLLLAIHELQSPAKELLDQGEELAQYIRKQQLTDGSLRLSENGGETIADLEAVQTYPGMALYGLMLSQRNRPAEWKREVVARALPYYRQQWKANRNLPSAAWLTLACAECYVRAPERTLAEFVFEMSDWVCSRQYEADSRNVKCVGGFRGPTESKTALPAPRIDAAVNLEALAQACLVTRHIPDAARYGKYQECLESGAVFLTTLQFSESNTLHFTPAYRTALIGGFHPTHDDGNLRLDYSLHAICSLIECLTCSGKP